MPQPPKSRKDKGGQALSLSGLGFEEAIRAAMLTGTAPQKKRKVVAKKPKAK